MLIAPLLVAGAMSLAGPANLLLSRPVEGHGLRGRPAAVTDGLQPDEGTEGSTEVALLEDETSVLVVPLGEVREIRGIVLQAEADDEYFVEGSLDGRHWTGLVHVRPAALARGLQTQAIALPVPESVRFLAVHARGGDGHYAVSELAAFEQPPPGVALPSAVSPRDRGTRPGEAAGGALGLLTEPRMIAWKAALAAAGAFLLAWGIRLRRQGRAHHRAAGRDAALALLGLLAVASWWNLGAFHHRNYTHGWDTFHYFVGAKYFPELGYTGLYGCAIAADLENGRIDPETPFAVTDLVTNHLAPVRPASALAECRSRFGAERWRAFTADVAFFHDLEAPRWHAILQDHGYNATPVWGIAGRFLSSLGPATARLVGALTVIDSLLLLGMWGLVAWAFGWRSACVAALFWGTNFPARFWWNGGAFLRMDWLVCAVAGVCLLKRERPRLAGALLMAAALLRVFPGAILLGLAVAALARMAGARRWSLRPQESRLAQGALLSLALLVPLSFAAAGPRGPGAWKEFALNSRKHLGTPLNNNMGLKTLLAFRPAQRESRLVDARLVEPWGPWKEARLRAARAARPLYAVLAIGAVALFAIALREHAPWVVAAAAVGLVPFTTELACYYYSLLIGLALLYAVREEAGVVLVAFAALSNVVPWLFRGEEDRYLAESLLALVTVLVAWGAVLRSRAAAMARPRPS